jgi:cytochrome c peroxidase
VPQPRSLALQLRQAALAAALLVCLAASAVAQGQAQAPALPNLLPMPNDSGFAATYSLAGVIDQTGPFFQSLGSNGRSCASCHQAAEGWTITPRGLKQRFERSGGTDPVFRPVDGANSPHADVSTVRARRRAYSVLLDKGLIRVGIAIPAGAEFELAAVDDPYGYASAAELSLFRRPLPTTNLGLLSTVMWDGRETFKDASSSHCVVGTSNCFADIDSDLADQSNVATSTHAQALAPLNAAQRAGIVSFESALHTAQVYDREAGPLTAQGARGGPVVLAGQTFHFGINDTLAGDYLTHLPFDPKAMTLYDAWAGPSATGAGGAARPGRLSDDQRAVARGQALFNTKPIKITGVSGLNDDLGLPTINGSCTTCHNAPNAGDHSVPLPLGIGVADAAQRTPDLPLYTLRNLATGATVQVSDPGRALVTGKWKDIGRFKGPVLRALATRAPYFHNGMAADLGAAVDFYNTRFKIGLTAAERADLIAFLRTL